MNVLFRIGARMNIGTRYIGGRGSRIPYTTRELEQDHMNSNMDIVAVILMIPMKPL